MDNNMPPQQPQLCRPCGTFVGEKNYPSQGGNSYLQDMHEEEIIQYQLGLLLVSPDLDMLRKEYQYPSVWTCWQWIGRFVQYGHAWLKYDMGHRMAQRQVLKQHLGWLAVF
jgi:hypothetical protein